MAKTIKIGGRLESVETGNIVTGANQVLDDEKGKKQSVINGEVDAELVRLGETKQDVLTFDYAPTEGSNNPVKSGGVYTADALLQQAIEAILVLIPSAASALNKLVDEQKMNSSISTNTATFRGTYNSVVDLHLAVDATHQQIADALDSIITTADNNDYSYVQIPVSAQTYDIRKTERYKYNGTAWAFEYNLNTSGFTADQWAAINSGVNATIVGEVGDIQNVIPSEATIANKLTDKAYVDALIEAITELIPSEASTSNQLADKAYVIATILAAIPAFKGTFETLAGLEAVPSPKDGDIGIVLTTADDGLLTYGFYQYLNNDWNQYYTLSQRPKDKPASTGITGDYPYNGMGRVVLQKNIVSNVNTLTQDMFNKGEIGSRVPNTNTIFVIQYDFVLGEDITVPANCVLDFDGGSIAASGNNDTITGNNTQILHTNPFISNNIIVSGCYVNEGLLKDTDVFKAVSGTQNEIEVLIGLAKEGSKLLFTAQSYQDIHDVVISKSISLDFNNATVYAVIRNTNDNQQVFKSITGVGNIEFHNVSVNGQLPIEVGESSGATGQYNAAILVKNADNVVFDNVEIKNFVYGGTGEMDPDIRVRDNMGVCVVLGYKNLTVDKCKLSKCVGEGFYLVPVIGDNYAVITNNVVSDFTNSGFNVFDGEIYFANNAFTNGKFSATNLMCYNSVIINNTFTNTGKEDFCIDLSEENEYYSKNVLITDNQFTDCNYSIGVAGHDIKIINNTINRGISGIRFKPLINSYPYNNNSPYGNETTVEIINNHINAQYYINYQNNNNSRSIICGNTFTYRTVSSSKLTPIGGYSIKEFKFIENSIEGENEGYGTSSLSSITFSTEKLEYIYIKGNTFTEKTDNCYAVFLLNGGDNNYSADSMVFSNNTANESCFVASVVGFNNVEFDDNTNITVHPYLLTNFLNKGSLYKEIKSHFISVGSITLRENSILNFVGGSIKTGNTLIGNKTLLLGDLSQNDISSYNGTYKNFGTIRPTNVPIGFCFFDTSSSVNKPIYWNGTAWVDATGATV